MSTVEAQRAPSGSGRKPWLVLVDGKMLTTTRGNGRRFAAKEAAEAAGGVAALADAVAYVNEHHSLPRCSHGEALRDHASDRLEPPCGCRS